jgi:hypothetical protein
MGEGKHCYGPGDAMVGDWIRYRSGYYGSGRLAVVRSLGIDDASSGPYAVTDEGNVLFDQIVDNPSADRACVPRRLLSAGGRHDRRYRTRSLAVHGRCGRDARAKRAPRAQPRGVSPRDAGSLTHRPAANALIVPPAKRADDGHENVRFAVHGAARQSLRDLGLGLLQLLHDSAASGFLTRALSLCERREPPFDRAGHT